MVQEAKALDIVELVEQAVAKHGARRDAVIPILNEINQAFGYIPTAALPEIRRRIHAPAEGVFLADSHLYSAASFYQLFSLKPLGRHVIRFCESAPCHVMGGRQVIQALQNELGLEIGETSQDGKWSLLTTSCLGVCGVGPVFLVDDDIYGNVTSDQVPEILARYK
ncbi:MAG: NAD(P)H-dependent oxidoreductase subunit E [Anaerolineae bacterium]|nr:MAG: NAD(P)H-dependent oxidoreductase subunit E [Anaerolineae bacterium]